MADFFSNLVYSEDDVILFPNGIPGFQDHTQFVLVEVPDYAPFEWLACVDGSKLRFAVINPLLFRPDYSPNVNKQQIADLEIEKPEDILMYAIVTIKENTFESTANLVGPVVINRAKRRGKQIIVDDDRYGTQEPILRKK